MRASSLDRLLACPASYIAPSGPRIESGDDGARLGTALHRVMVGIVTNQDVDVTQTAREEQVDADEVFILSLLGKRFWDKYGDAFPDPQCEVELIDKTPFGGLNLIGHPDVMSCVDGQVRVLDWKSGRVDAPHAEQMRAYCYLACQHYGAKSAWVGIARLREQELIPAEYTWDELVAWYNAAESKLQREPTYNPQPEICQYCPRRMECPARVAAMRHSLQVLVDMDETPTGMDLATFTGEEIRHGVFAARAIAKLCEEYLRLAKTEVLIRGGIPGLEVIQEERREIIARDAWPILEGRLSLPVLLDCVKVGKTKVEDAIRETVGKGQKAAAVRDVLAELDAVGALTVKKTDKLICKQVPQAIEVQ